MKKFGISAILISGFAALFSLDSALAQSSASNSAGASAADEEFSGGERSVRAPSSVGRNGVTRKRYAGGPDEDDVQVQETLPIPSRTFDGTVGSTADKPSESEGSEPASND